MEAQEEGEEDCERNRIAMTDPLIILERFLQQNRLVCVMQFGEVYFWDDMAFERKERIFDNRGTPKFEENLKKQIEKISKLLEEHNKKSDESVRSKNRIYRMEKRLRKKYNQNGHG